jgi:hypothetical protein
MHAVLIGPLALLLSPGQITGNGATKKGDDAEGVAGSLAGAVESKSTPLGASKFQ